MPLNKERLRAELGSLLSHPNDGQLSSFNTVEFTTNVNPYDDLRTLERAHTPMNSPTNTHTPELKDSNKQTHAQKHMHTNPAHDRTNYKRIAITFKQAQAACSPWASRQRLLVSEAQ